ncbi:MULTISPECIES: ScpA family protein [unclassified Moraxella]|uniref:segregation and condensation protein A n=1 Tax=unclassified Moraxella TaxID=2685852 RepID=UPI002B408C76|nr:MULTISPECIES: ScpA family protein [unclassified Moraxella]
MTDTITNLATNDTQIRIFDTPVESLPEDLYIPPQAFAIWLEQFAGPLDFLLYLVKKNNFDLTETAILPITEQYLSYIKDLDEEYFELAGDYLLMASTLIAIKSELLLPQASINDEELSPKARLIQKLEEYAQIKEAAKRLDNLIRLERDVFLAFTSLPSTQAMRAELPKYSPQILVDSLINMQIKPDYQMHTVAIDPVPLPERIAAITRTLSKKGMATFKELLEPTQGKLGVVVSFVAILELIKRGLVGFDEYPTDDFDDESADNYALTTEKQAKNTLPSVDNIGYAIGEQTLYWLR